MSPIYSSLPTFADTDIGFSYSPTITYSNVVGVDWATQAVGIGVWLCAVNIATAYTATDNGAYSLTLTDGTTSVNIPKDILIGGTNMNSYNCSFVFSRSTATTIILEVLEAGVSTTTLTANRAKFTITRIA